MINERHLALSSHSSRLWNDICKHSSLSHSIQISSKDVSSNSTCNASSRHLLNCSWQARVLPIQHWRCYFLKLQERPASSVIIEPLAIIWRWWNVRSDCFSIIMLQVDATKFTVFSKCVINHWFLTVLLWLNWDGREKTMLDANNKMSLESCIFKTGLCNINSEEKKVPISFVVDDSQTLCWLIR